MSWLSENTSYYSELWLVRYRVPGVNGLLREASTFTLRTAITTRGCASTAQAVVLMSGRKPIHWLRSVAGDVTIQSTGLTIIWSKAREKPIVGASELQRDHFVQFSAKKALCGLLGAL